MSARKVYRPWWVNHRAMRAEAALFAEIGKRAFDDLMEENSNPTFRRAPSVAWARYDALVRRKAV